MKLSKLIILIILISTFTFQSCIESVLDTENPSSISTGNFPKSEDDLRAILIGLYNGVRSEYNRTTYGEDRSDSFDVGLIGSVSDAWGENLSGSNGPNWRTNYNLINNVNIVLTTAQKIEFSSNTKKRQIMGEAYFLRAFIYFQMVKIWGDVPLLLDPVDQNTPLAGRTAAKDIMNQVFTDITSAIDQLPSTGFSSTKYMASKPAAYALEADASLWYGKVYNGGDAYYNKAITAVNNISGVNLLSKFGDIFDIKENNEVIFASFFDFNEKDGMYASTLTSRDIQVDPVLNPDVPTSTSLNARHNYRPSDKIMALFTDTNDQRTIRSFIPILTQDGPDAGTEPDILSYSQNKFRGTNYNNDTFYDNDVIIYRWGDLVLLRAEANAAIGDAAHLQAAVTDLNLIKNRAHTALYSGALDKQSVEKEVLNERGRELFLELKRYWDLVRFNAESVINIYTEVPNLVGKTIPLLWPVNNNIIAENNLIEQTEGFN